jgi:hypothetical protein
MLTIYLYILPCLVFIFISCMLTIYLYILPLFLIVYYFSMQVIEQYEQAIIVLPA